MTPGARLQAIIDLVDELTTAWKDGKRLPADVAIGGYFRARRFIGSKDRGFIAEHVYFIIRNYACLIWWCEGFKMPVNARTLAIAALTLQYQHNIDELMTFFSNDRYTPARLDTREKAFGEWLKGKTLTNNDQPDAVRYNYPEWMEPELKAVFGMKLPKAMLALNQEAPIDLRANLLKTTREELIEALKKEGFDGIPTKLSPWGIRLEKRNAAFATEAFKKGWFEMQDEGSQLVALVSDARPGQKVIDFCAGAGGKSLALAAMMKNKGRLLAWDISSRRMQDIAKRLKRAGVDNTQTTLLASEQDGFIKRHKDSADRVLVDAPCSGSGTWRRNPDLKWRTHPQDIAELVELQQRILTSAARTVKPGGYMIYATCSLLESENERQVSWFLEQNTNFRVVSAKEMWDKIPPGLGNENHFLRLSPHKEGTDGFFAAILERTPTNAP